MNVVLLIITSFVLAYLAGYKWAEAVDANGFNAKILPSILFILYLTLAVLINPLLFKNVEGAPTETQKEVTEEILK